MIVKMMSEFEARYEPQTDEDRAYLRRFVAAIFKERDQYFDRARAMKDRHARIFFSAKPKFEDLPPQMSAAMFHDGTAIVTVGKWEDPEWIQKMRR